MTPRVCWLPLDPDPDVCGFYFCLEPDRNLTTGRRAYHMMYGEAYIATVHEECVPRFILQFHNRLRADMN